LPGVSAYQPKKYLSAVFENLEECRHLPDYGTGAAAGRHTLWRKYMSSIPERLSALREEMAAGKIEAYLIFGTDPHMSEYVAERWRDRAWISGFTGSAGTFVCTREKAGLWTDSRYYVQAAGELDGSGIALFRQGEADVPGICEWLGQELPREAVVGADGWTISAELYRSFQQQLGVYGLELHASEDLIDRIWDGRPGLPEEDIYQHDLRYAGRSRQEKIEQLQQHLQGLKADYQLLSSLAVQPAGGRY
jgi:Xaa-Pro aminopeptidase